MDFFTKIHIKNGHCLIIKAYLLSQRTLIIPCVPGKVTKERKLNYIEFFSHIYRSKKDFYPLTSLDIVCHEIGHAMTEWHGGDMEYDGEMGAMNEAYSDILGKS